MPTPAEKPTKPCAVCGRVITWRKKWERDWSGVRYCSEACRRRARSKNAALQDSELEHAILDLLAQRPRGGTICPSEAARAVSPDHWRDLVEPARAAARRLVTLGEVEIIRQGRAVDPSTARGLVRVRRRTR